MTPLIQFARWQHWAKHMKQSEVLWGTCGGPHWELAEQGEELHGNTMKQQRSQQNRTNERTMLLNFQGPGGMELLETHDR